MKCPGPVRLVLLLVAVAWVSSLPTKESTTRRNNLTDGHNTDNKTLLSISNTTTNHTDIITQYTPRNLHTYKRTSTRLVNSTKLKKHKVRTTIKPIIDMVKIMTISTEMNDSKIKNTTDMVLINNFFKNNLEDLNAPNKTFKIIRVNQSISTDLTKNDTRTPTVKIHTTNQPVKPQIKTKTKKNKTNKIKGTNSSDNRRKSNRTTTTKPSINGIKQNKTWPNTNIKNAQALNRYKNYTQSGSTHKKRKRKPVVHKVISKWSDKPPYNEFKESWYDHGIPIPNPRPEISTYSPQFSINTVLPLEITGDEVEESSPDSPPGTLLNQISLDMNSSDGRPAGNSEGIQIPDCPTVHLTNSVFGPSGRQECSDLNIAINTHIHQNQAPNRRPETVQSEPLGAADTSAIEVPAAVIGDTNTAPVEDVVPVAADTAGTTAGTGGGGSPSLPGLPHLPHFGGLQNILRLLGSLRVGWNLLSGLFRLLKPLAPLLLIFPLLSFLFGFALVLPFYPWWLPFIFLFAKKKEQAPRPEIYLHNHVHKPINHYDGWFWNHNTKTWTNLADYVHHRSDDDNEDGRSGEVPTHIEGFRRKYEDQDQNTESWKRRKK